MKKLPVYLSFLVFLLFFPFPTFAQQPPTKGVGINTAVFLSSITEQDIDRVAEANGGMPGGTITALVNDQETQNKERFAHLASYAADKGITFIVLADSAPNPNSLADFINAGLTAIRDKPVKNIGLVFETEANDIKTTRFPVIPTAENHAESYVTYVRTALNTVYATPYGKNVIGMLSNLNISHPGGEGSLTAEEWYRRVVEVDRKRPAGTPSIFELVRALATNSYPVSPQGNPNIEGVLSYQRDWEILRSLGVDIKNLQAVYIMETGLQFPQQIQDIASQKGFIEKFLQSWANDPHIVSVNFFNGLGKNPDFPFFSLLENGKWPEAILALFLKLKNEGKVWFLPANFVPLDLSKLFKCEDNKGNFMGYTLSQEDCQALNQLAQKYGKCGADRPFTGGAVTRGKSFIIRVSAHFNTLEEKKQEVAKTIKIIREQNSEDNETAFTDIKRIPFQLEKTLPKLTPINYKPVVFKKSKLGNAKYEVCDTETNEWFIVEDKIETKTPDWVEQMKDQGLELAKMLVPKESEGMVLGEKTGPETNPQNQPLVSIRSVSCYATNREGRCTVVVDGSGTGHVWIHANGEFLGINRVGRDLVYYYNFSLPPEAKSFEVNVNVTNHDIQPKPTDNSVCKLTLDKQGNGSCQSGGGYPPPPPQPRKCEEYIPKGLDFGKKIEYICVNGKCKLKVSLAKGIVQEVEELAGKIEAGIRKILWGERKFIVTPLFITPYLDEADTFLRTETFSIFKTISPDAVEAFRFKHGLAETYHWVENENTYPSEKEVYGTGGLKTSYQWEQDALTPFTPPKAFQQIQTALPFRNPSDEITNKDRVIKAVSSLWPNSKIAQEFDNIRNQAVANGWSPAFVIALWIEESGASGVPGAYALGYTKGDPEDLQSQLNGLFNLPYANESFEEFMCRYSEGKPAPCEFKINPNFPRNLEYWYRQLKGS